MLFIFLHRFNLEDLPSNGFDKQDGTSFNLVLVIIIVVVQINFSVVTTVT